MKKVILYIAMSLDGYIADVNGGVHWLTDENGGIDNMGSYPEFIKTVDTVILGYRTYHQITTELSRDYWIYADKKSYVFTHKHMNSTQNITFTAENPDSLIRRLKCEAGGDIWICGGADVANQMIDLNLINIYHITVIPTILGNGIKLFGFHEKETRLKLIGTQPYNGMVDLIYEPFNQGI